MFVDVEIERTDGKLRIERLLVIKDKHGKWGDYLHPHLTPLLSTGLDQEAPSEKDFSDVYSTK